MSKHQGKVLLSLSAVLVLLVVLNVWLQSQIRDQQRLVAERQQFISQSVSLQGLNNEIIKALAELATRDNDTDIRGLLNANGVTFNATGPANGSAP
jgi:ATP-dependent protease ClpP protease subunit